MTVCNKETNFSGHLSKAPGVWSTRGNTKIKSIILVRALIPEGDLGVIYGLHMGWVTYGALGAGEGWMMVRFSGDCQVRVKSQKYSKLDILLG